MEWWNNAKWCHLAVNWTPATLLVLLARAACNKSLTLHLVSAHIHSTITQPLSKSRFTPFSLLAGRYSERIGFNSRYLDGLLMQFFKTHFTDTTGAIKDPQRNICIEECLYFALIVHLLWQTSKSRESALLNAIYCGEEMFWWNKLYRVISTPALHWEEAARKWQGALTQNNTIK